MFNVFSQLNIVLFSVLMVEPEGKMAEKCMRSGNWNTAIRIVTMIKNGTNNTKLNQTNIVSKI